MRQLKYKGRGTHFLIEYPRLSEPYLFKKSANFVSDVQEDDAKWLLVHHKDIFDDVTVPAEVVVKRGRPPKDEGVIARVA